MKKKTFLNRRVHLQMLFVLAPGHPGFCRDAQVLTSKIEKKKHLDEADIETVRTLV